MQAYIKGSKLSTLKKTTITAKLLGNLAKNTLKSKNSMMFENLTPQVKSGL